MFTEGDRNNRIIDPQLRGISRTFDGVLDPRPAEGSPALKGMVSTILDPFFRKVEFKGAFGEVNWAHSWTALGRGGDLSADGAGEPSSDTTTSPGNSGNRGFTSITVAEDGHVRIEFSGSLQWFDSVDGVYRSVDGAVSPYVVAPGSGSQF